MTGPVFVIQGKENEANPFGPRQSLIKKVSATAKRKDLLKGKTF